MAAVCDWTFFSLHFEMPHFCMYAVRLITGLHKLLICINCGMPKMFNGFWVTLVTWLCFLKMCLVLPDRHVVLTMTFFDLAMQNSFGFRALSLNPHSPPKKKLRGRESVLYGLWDQSYVPCLLLSLFLPLLRRHPPFFFIFISESILRATDRHIWPVVKNSRKAAEMVSLWLVFPQTKSPL